MRPLLLSCFVFFLLTPVAGAQTEASSASAAASGSGTDIWTERAERAATFGSEWGSFALVHSGWMTKWQKAREKLIAHIDRCHTSVRSANRDTLLRVTLQCERGQLILERDALSNEREVIRQWPGIPDATKTAMLGSSDALRDAIQPIIDAIDANVFTTLDTFRDVRANLLTQYRQPYWISSARFRADAALTWLDSLLLSLHALTQEGVLPAPVQENTLAALRCYEAAEPLLIAARDAETPEETRKNFTLALTTFPPCAALLREAQTLQQAASSSLSSEAP